MSDRESNKTLQVTSIDKINIKVCLGLLTKTDTVCKFSIRFVAIKSQQKYNSLLKHNRIRSIAILFVFRRLVLHTNRPLKHKYIFTDAYNIQCTFTLICHLYTIVLLFFSLVTEFVFVSPLNSLVFQLICREKTILTYFVFTFFSRSS